MVRIKGPRRAGKDASQAVKRFGARGEIRYAD